MMTKKLVIIALVIGCMTASCKDKVKTTVDGWWSIDTLYYQNYEIRTCLLGNWLIFNDDGSVKLPIPENRCSELVTEYNEKGNWEVLSNDNGVLSIKIESKNTIFKGKHQIVFRRDEQNSLLMMEIKSGNLYVLCRKGLFNYDRNQELIIDLEKMSGGKPLERDLRLLDRDTFNHSGVQDDNTFLQTGWYYIADTGVKRQLDKSSEAYFVIPVPITTAKNIISFKLDKLNQNGGHWGLVMQLNEEGTNKWSIATEKATGKRIAFIVNNRLLHTANVNGKINNGITVLNRNVYTREELDSFMRIIEK